MVNQKIVLYYLLTSKKLFDTMILRGLNQDWFTGTYRLIYNAIVQYRLKYVVDEIVITNLNIDIKAKKKLGELLDVPDQYETFLWEQYFEALKKEYLEREVKKMIKNIEYTPESLIKLSERLSSLATSHSYNKKDIEEIIDEAIIEIDNRQSDNYQAEFKTGIYNYDKLGYFERGSLVVIGGESGHGKSKIILNLIIKWLGKGHRIVLFSYEMSPKFIIMLLGMIKENISWSKMFRKNNEKLSPEEQNRLIEAIKSYKDKPLLINTTARSFSEMKLIVENYKADIMLIDTINHLIKTGDRQDIALGEIARGCKDLAEEKNILSVIVAQLKDLESRKGIKTRPTDKNLIKESREIRDAADYMDFIYREEEKKAGLVDDIWKDVLEVYRVKGRYVGVGWTFLRFNKETGRIGDLEDWEIETIKQQLIGG